MAKKARITYVGSPQSIPQTIISQVPTFEESGIKYQGKYKTDKGNGLFELRTQMTRFYALGIANGAFGSTITARTGKRFYCTKAFVQWCGMSGFSYTLNRIHLADVKNSNAEIRFYFWPTTAAGETTLDFTDSPRLFEGDSFDFYTQASLGAGQFIVIQLFGWEEE